MRVPLVSEFARISYTSIFPHKVFSTLFVFFFKNFPVKSVLCFVDSTITIVIKWVMLLKLKKTFKSMYFFVSNKLYWLIMEFIDSIKKMYAINQQTRIKLFISYSYLYLYSSFFFQTQSSIFNTYSIWSTSSTSKYFEFKIFVFT